MISQRGRPETQLILVGAGSGLLYAATYAAQRGLRGNSTPLATRLPRLDILLYLVATVGLFLLYGLLLMICRRGGLGTPRARVLAFAFPVAFNIAFLAAAPNLSIDLLSYISHGYIRAVLHGNPYVLPSSAVAHTAIGPQLAAFGWRPVHPVSPYGPLWTHLETAIAYASDSVRVQMVMLKAVVVVASLGSAWLIWLILGRVRPEYQTLGTLAYLWNPMIVVELAGEGHNDSVMVFFVLMALALTLRGRGTAGMSAMSLGVLTKYLPAALILPQVTYLWRIRRSAGRAAAHVVSGLAISLGLAVASFASLWAGTRTLVGIRMSGQLGETGSTPTVILHILSPIVPPAAAKPLTYALAIAAFGIYLAVRTFSISDTIGLLRTAMGVGLVYLLFASPAYWPWYAVMPVALLALEPEGLWFALILSVSVGSRLTAPLDVMFVNGWIARRDFLWITWAAGIGVSSLLLIWRLAARIRATSGPRR
jgi:alpha-1,6-mannosyltransferase